MEIITHQHTIEAIEIILTAISLAVLIFSTFYIALQLRRGRMWPRSVWYYAGAVSTVVLLWRVVVLVSAFFPGVIGYADGIPLPSPISAAIYILIGTTFSILAYCGSKVRPVNE